MKTSRTQKVVDILLQRKSSDDEIANELKIEKIFIQQAICNINFSKKKFKEFTIIKNGKHGNYVREIVTNNSGENEIIDDADKKGKKALKQFDGRKKLLSIGLNTRQGQLNRDSLIRSVLHQNLEMSIEAQKLLN